MYIFLTLQTYISLHRSQLLASSSSADVVLTSKHHEGWCNFRNDYHWNWNSIDEGPKRDLVGDLTASVRKAGLRMGLYHSLREWYNPAYIMVGILVLRLHFFSSTNVYGGFYSFPFFTPSLSAPRPLSLPHSLPHLSSPAALSSSSLSQDQDNNCSTTAFVDDILIPTMKQMVEEYQVITACTIELHQEPHDYGWCLIFLP